MSPKTWAGGHAEQVTTWWWEAHSTNTLYWTISTADSVAVPSVQVFRQDSNVSEGGGGAAGEWTYPSNTYLCSQTYAHQKLCIQENLRSLES